ncbi:MAG: GNAT family protein [Paludibacteraceae bacterium]
MKTILIPPSIKLKPITESDALHIFEIIDSEREYFAKWLPFVPFVKSVEDELNYIRSIFATPEDEREIVFCIYYTDIFVGLIGLKFNADNKANQKTEIGYWLSEKHQGKGIITTSVKVLLNLAFSELKLNRVQIRCATGNIGSKNIPKRLGFVLEGIERDGELLANGNFTDLEIYSMLKKDFFSAEQEKHEC